MFLVSCFSLQSSLKFSRFLELGAILEPGRPPKADKVAILSDALRIVHQLRSEAQKLKESNEELQAKIKELKVKFVSKKKKNQIEFFNLSFWKINFNSPNAASYAFTKNKIVIVVHFLRKSASF